MMRQLCIMVCLAAGMASATADAASLDFSYNPNPDTDHYTVFGYQKKETYDVAIRITDPALVGTTVSSIRVYIPVEPEWITDPSAWMSTELRLENKKNAPDITTQAATVADRFLTATFAEPYTITADGVYVGYSFTVTELHDYSTSPIAGVEGYNPDGLYVHSSRTRLKWMSEVAEKNLVSGLVVTVQTESGPTDVGAGLPAESFTVAGEEGMISVDFINYGTEPLSEVGYSWACDTESGKGSVMLAAPLQPGERSTEQIAVGPCPNIGTYPLTVTLETFNGQPNNDTRKTARGTMVVMPFMPVTRPLVEEYTGLRCQYCPRGYVAMEQMSEDYGDRFIGLAYHTETYETGCMVVMPNSAFPISAPGFPYGSLNRDYRDDPSLIPNRWGAAAAVIAPADLDVTLDWTDGSHSAVEAKADIRFARSLRDLDMNVAIYLVADGLRNPEWYQINAFSGSTDPECTGPLWDIFTKGGSTVWDLTFNDVVASCDDTRGVSGIIPAEVEPATTASCSRTFRLEDVVNVQGERFLSDGSRLKAVAVLIDNRTGFAVNANKSAPLPYDESIYGGVASAASGEIVATEYYDLLGRRIQTPAAGTPLIRIDRSSDGTSTRSKVIL